MAVMFFWGFLGVNSSQSRSKSKSWCKIVHPNYLIEPNTVGLCFKSLNHISFSKLYTRLTTNFSSSLRDIWIVPSHQNHWERWPLSPKFHMNTVWMRSLKFKPDRKGERYPAETKEQKTRISGSLGNLSSVCVCVTVSMKEGWPLAPVALKDREKGRGRRPGLTFRCQSVHLFLVPPFPFSLSSLHLSILLIILCSYCCVRVL